MLRSLVSPLFLQEMGKARKKDAGFKIPPMPVGYSFKRVTNKKYVLLYLGEIVSTFQQLADITEKVKLHQAQLEGKKIYTIRRISTYRVHVFLNGEFRRSFQSIPAAEKFVWQQTEK